MLKKFLLISLFLFSSYTVANMDNTQYSVYFKTEYGVCLLKINEVIYLDTLTGPKTISTGADMTGWLENGENDVGLIFYPARTKVQYDKKYCEVKIVKKVPGQQEKIITNFKITFDGKSERSDKSAYSVVDISDTTGNKLMEGTYNKIKFDNDPAPKDWITAVRKINASNIPEWAWTKATPQENNANLRNQLISAYQGLITDLSKNDLRTIKRKYSIALEEYVKSNPSYSKDEFFSSIGIEDAMANGTLVLHPDWSKYNVYFYQKDRVFCLAMDEGKRNSPIRFYDSNGDFVFAWNPFFSMINGKLVLVR
ncbi:hypothetical protein DLR11_25050 [Salmonella enterica subsp. salamae]|uniref:Uncharacterized protein n=1 Tax=Salmonella enterica subsp. salamae TaxID=59202 RepID=A0A5Y3V8Y8_SALER|nr:hypothetical protein [Salmonella enterica subsp. salamae]EEO8346953.1 hypothetical protein [Salmonella enterica]ECI3455005.1 hypothetical protein [Salmonella enterica subsp. salamae]ECJ2328628.1 hypothetical protein [Salmonella enterica subsp. salamae]EDV0905548.1 hypothetical protein [Salmonella enterica subsp. salamae]